jgi:hypothetical protein
MPQGTSSHFLTGKSELSEVDRGFAGLAGEFLDRQRIEPAVFDEMRSALVEFKVLVMTFALGAQIQNPGVV